jgi:hypothetical protein
MVVRLETALLKFLFSPPIVLQGAKDDKYIVLVSSCNDLF